MTNKSRITIPRLPFADIKNDILGKKYDLSLAFVTPKESERLALTYKKKRYEANVLSFRLSKTTGEIVISPQVAKSQAKDFGKNFKEMLGLLFIHGCYHLVGHSHGSRMETQERRLRSKYGF